MIAERAGVQRHTLYAYFPDELSLQLACSGAFHARDPMPDAEPWRGIADRAVRLRIGLGELYAWYERNAQLVACVSRDAEFHAPSQEICALRVAPKMAAYREVLGAELNAQQRALLALALSFYTWRTLTRDSGLNKSAAVDVMVEAIAVS